MTINFSQPRGGDQIALDELLDVLCIIVPREADTIATAHGEADVIHATVIEVDGKFAGTVRTGPLFGKVIYARLSNSIGDVVLARIGKGDAKRGQSAPWILKDHSEADERAAQKLLSDNPDLMKAITGSGAAPKEGRREQSSGGGRSDGGGRDSRADDNVNVGGGGSGGGSGASSGNSGGRPARRF